MARASHRAALRPDRQPVAGAGGGLWQGVALEVALAVVTANPARALGLATKGTLAVGQDADLLLIDPDTLTIERVMSGGRWRT